MSIENQMLVSHISKTFATSRGLFRKETREAIAVDDVSFNLDLEKSGILTIAGESGSGKTTIARLILRFIKPDKGEILYRGQNIWKMNKKELKNYRRKVQAVFQDPFAAFNPIYKVDHLLRATIKKFGLAKSEKETEDLLLKSFEFLKLRPEMLSKYPSQLSGGERQRVMLCRAILPKPDLIIADEPVSMLDTTIRIGVLEEMLKVKEQFGVSFIYITHDLATASVLGGDVMILYQGSAVEMGPIDKVLRRPAHPYTQLLVSSIPSPDPDRKSSFLDLSKMTAPTQEKGEIKTGRIKGCKFYSRCDRRRESCLSESPQMLEMGDRLVRCPFAED